MTLLEKIDQFVARFLPDDPVAAATSKFIHDPIWGTIELAPHEHVILDTPLLQRLRQIHQTGFSYATYPCATHTRFEHTLGVLHLASKIAVQLQRKYSEEADLLRKTEQKVRLAALMHDTGHSAFSHTSEEIYGQCSDLRELTQSGGTFEGKGAGEVFSYLITTSVPFRKFFDKIKKAYPKLQTEIDEFAPLMLGRSKDPNLFFEAEIISGPFDADKLDYFPRDGRAAGIELSIDIARLLHCVELAVQQKNEVPTRGLVVNRGGFNALQQLLFARATLFSTVYHHHKVRACDCMIKGSFEKFELQGKPFKKNAAFQGVDLKSAADYLHITDADFFGEAYSHSESSEEHKIIHDVLYRRLLKRVLVVTTRSVVRSATSKASYAAFFNLRSSPEDRRALAIKILDKAGLLAWRAYVWVDIPKEPSFSKAGEARINLASRTSTVPEIQPLSEFIPVSKWVQTYHHYLTESFVFGPPDPEIRQKLARAATDVLRADFGLELNINAYAPDIRALLGDLNIPNGISGQGENAVEAVDSIND